MSAALFLILTRGLALAAVLQAFGAALARAFVAAPSLAGAPKPDRLAVEAIFTILLRWALVAAIVGTILGLPFQAAEMAGADDVATSFGAIPDVLVYTGAGHALIARILLLAIAWPVFGRGRSVFMALCAAELVGIALALQVALGHAAAAEDWDLPEAEILHLLAAGAWLGGLLPLFLLVRRLAPAQSAVAARRFSPLGIAAVLVLALTALIQTFLLVGGLPGLLGTDYGHIALAKLALFLVLLGFAAINRNWLTPALAGKDARRARAHLLRSIAGETAVGLAIVLAAAWMATLSPGIHEQPVWPLDWRPSAEALSDPDLRAEVLQACAMLAGALALFVAGLVWRRWILLAIAAAVSLVYFALPHLEPLQVEAYPTSYYRSPTGFTGTSIAAGADLYPAQCAACHGADRRGDGPQAHGLEIPPADLTAEHLWGHSDGELFWWLSDGMDAPSGGKAMPGFAGTLDEDQRWDLIDYIRAANAGDHATDRWAVPLQAPDISASCDDGRVLDLADLHGQAVRIVIGDDASPGPADLVTIRLAPEPGKGCVDSDAADLRAYAIIAGRAPDALTGALAGAQFLVDSGGWLRALWRPGDAPGWTQPQALSVLSDRVAKAPLQGSAGGHMHH